MTSQPLSVVKKVRIKTVNNEVLMKKVLLIDVDGVILDWNTEFDAHMVGLGYELRQGYDKYYHLPHRYNVDAETMHEIITGFNTSVAISTLSAYKDSLTYLKKLNELGFAIHAITSIGDNRISRHYRATNLKKVFGGDMFASISCVPMYSSKVEALSEWKDTGYIWVEDTPTNANAGLELGLTPYIIPHSYNDGEHTHIPRVSHDTPWEDLYAVIIAHYNII